MNERIHRWYWMKIAQDVAKASTCRANVGCILVHKKVIVGVGYVGSVHGDYHCMVEEKKENPYHSHVLVKTSRKGSADTGDTCIRTIHAEVNAILKCEVRGSVADGWIECYSTYQPCLECTKLLMQIGVRSIHYMKAYKDVWRDKYLKEVDQTILPLFIEVKL